MSFSLNDAQKAVVKHRSGPLLVVAGAGTGKTRVIIEKINKLLDEGVEASEILAVTFTEKAAAEMLDRILERRSSLLPELNIMTFNGFGAMLLREHGVHMGLPHNFRLLGPKAQIVFMRERIDEFELDYFLPLTGSPDGIIEDILKHISQLKQHVITPEQYIEFVKTLPEEDEATALEQQKYNELAKAYQTYIKLCRHENVIDYDDQIYLSIELLKKRPNVKQELQDQFNTIFVDEFQDTNPMQSELIDLIVGKIKNLIVVGDDDQSIYGFRGATLQNILSFKDRYPGTKEIALTQNYRSYQKILDAAHKLISNNNPHRLEASLNINKKLTSNTSGKRPQLKRFKSLSHEIAWITEDIEKLLLEGENPGEIAILTRKNQTAQLIHEALQVKNIDHRVIGAGTELYQTPIVRMLIELARTLTEPENNASLHHTLTSDLFGIPNQIIAPIAAKARLEHVLIQDLVVESGQDSVKKAAQLINSWRDNAGSNSVRILMWNAINDTGYYEQLKSKAGKNENSANAILHLSQFFSSLQEFESIAIQPTAAQYLISLPALMAAGETTEDGTLEISKNEITVTTVHKAKGLEWNTVYIPDVTELSFPWRKRGAGLTIPEALRSSSESPADEHYAEERRLMYVAATRARKNLIISYSDTTKTGTQRKPSRFINEMFGSDTAETNSHTLINDENDDLNNIANNYDAAVAIPSHIYDGSYVKLSVSQASVLMDCPLNFYYKFVLKAPEEPTPRTTYGSYLHTFFEIINKDRQKSSLRHLSEYMEEMILGWQRAGYVSKATQDKAFKQAQDTLERFYTEARDNPAAKAIEEPFEVDLLPEQIQLRGKIDVVHEIEGIEIRDYKTGNKVKDISAAKRRATSSAQLTMYALAWQIKTGELPDRLSLEFVDTGKIGSVKKTQRGIDGLRKRLNTAADCIRTGVFTPGSSHDYCIHPKI